MSKCNAVLIKGAGGLVEVTHARGKTLNTLGFSGLKGSRYLYPEEALYASQRGLLDIYTSNNSDEQPLSLINLLAWFESEAEASVPRVEGWGHITGFDSTCRSTGGSQGSSCIVNPVVAQYRCSFRAFISTYASLKTSGYIVRRYSAPNSTLVDADCCMDEVRGEQEPSKSCCSQLVKPTLSKSSMKEALENLSQRLSSRLTELRLPSDKAQNLTETNSCMDRANCTACNAAASDYTELKSNKITSETTSATESNSEFAKHAIHNLSPISDVFPLFSLWLPNASFKISSPPEPDMVVGITNSSLEQALISDWSTLQAITNMSPKRLRMAVVDEETLGIIYLQPPESSLTTKAKP